MYGQRCHIINPYPIGISGFDLKQIIAGRYIHQTGRTIISKLYPLVIQSLNSIYVFYSRRVNIVQGSKSYSEITFIRLQVLSLIVTIYVLPARSIILIMSDGKNDRGTNHSYATHRELYITHHIVTLKAIYQKIAKQA